MRKKLMLLFTTMLLVSGCSSEIQNNEKNTQSIVKQDEIIGVEEQEREIL